MIMDIVYTSKICKSFKCKAVRDLKWILFLYIS